MDLCDIYPDIYKDLCGFMPFPLFIRICGWFRIVYSRMDNG